MAGILVETYALRDTLSNNSNGLDLRVLHQLHGGAVDTAGRGKVDNDVNIGMLGNGLLNLLIDGQEGLAGAPVHLADELTTEGIDDASNRGCGTLADEVEIEHALDSTGLQTVDEASCLLVEESMGGERAQRPAGSSEAADVVVRGEVAGGRAGRGAITITIAIGTVGASCGRHLH